MAHLIHGVCPFSQDRRIQPRYLEFTFPVGLCVLIWLTGCSSQTPHLVARGASEKDRATELDTEHLFPSRFPDGPPAENPQTGQAGGVADSNRISVSRSQKPDEPTRRKPQGPFLDLVSYENNVPTGTETAARIRATVNSVPILDEEVREAIYPFLLATQRLPEPERSAKQKELFEREVQHLIEQEVILQDAFARLKDRPVVIEKFKEAAGKEFDKKIKALRERSSIKTDEEFKAWLQAQGMTAAGVRRQIERDFMATEYMRNRVANALDRVSLEQIQDYYQHHPEEFQIVDSVTWQDIFVDAGKFPSRDAARQFAGKLIGRARAGEDFLKLVNQYDNGDSSYRNGEGFGHRPGEIKPPEAEPILFKMHDGEIGPLVELKNGFHVIRLVKREHAGLKPCDEKVQTAIRRKLQMEAYEREYKRVLADLKRKAAIEISHN
jgi:parvulin-like peptidyl-prolyl isomerase